MPQNLITASFLTLMCGGFLLRWPAHPPPNNNNKIQQCHGFAWSNGSMSLALHRLRCQQACQVFVLVLLPLLVAALQKPPLGTQKCSSFCIHPPNLTTYAPRCWDQKELRCAVAASQDIPFFYHGISLASALWHSCLIRLINPFVAPFISSMPL